jgi:hypothetical protein
MTKPLERISIKFSGLLRRRQEYFVQLGIINDDKVKRKNERRHKNFDDQKVNHFDERRDKLKERKRKTETFRFMYERENNWKGSKDRTSVHDRETLRIHVELNLILRS